MRERQEYWKSVCWQRHVVGIVGELSLLCGLNRNQLRQQQDLMGSWY